MRRLWVLYTQLPTESATYRSELAAREADAAARERVEKSKPGAMRSGWRSLMGRMSGGD